MRWAVAGGLALFALGGATAFGDGATDGRGIHGIEVLADWQALPDVATRATAAAGEGVDITVHAWGDTARGCYLTVQSVAANGAEPSAALHEAVRDELARGAEVSEWTSPAPAESSFRFAAENLLGSARTVAVRADGLLHATTAACFYSSQSSDWCAPRCADLLNQLEVAP